MKTLKGKVTTALAGGAVGLAALGYILLLFVIIFGVSLVFNFIPASVAYMVVVWALDFSFSYWQVYWVTFLIVFVFGIRFNSSK